MDMKLIDSHQHVFWHGRDDKGLLADMDKYGIERAWILSWEEPGDETGSNYSAVLDPRYRGYGTPAPALPLAAVYEVAQRYPDRFIAGYCPHPLDPEAVGKLTAAIKILGVRVCGEWKFCIHFDDPRCLEIYKVAGQYGLPVVLHLDSPYMPPKGGKYVGNTRWKGGTIFNVINACKLCPETNFIGHAPGFWREITGDADERAESYMKPPRVPGGRLEALLEETPNLYADLSAGSALYALKMDPEYSRQILIKHADRFLFARDYYGGDMLEFLKSLNLPDDVWQKIGRGNAERLVAPVHIPPEI
jgi:predicted TIM-barrel fold metal-dependent hydrolase